MQAENRLPLTDDQRTLAESCYRLAWSLGLKFAIQHNLDQDECVSAAMLGLCCAARGFDASRGFAFTTYATPAIRTALLRRDVPLGSRYGLKFQTRILREGDFGGVSDDGPGIFSGIPAKLEACADFAADFAAGLSLLTERDREIVGFRVRGYTLEQIGRHFGCTKEAIRQRLIKIPERVLVRRRRGERARRLTVGVRPGSGGRGGARRSPVR